MPTIIDQTRKLSPCPWCKEPGRIVAHFDERLLIAMQAGCTNDKCKVQPRTQRFTAICGGREFAIDVVTKVWEARNNEQKIND